MSRFTRREMLQAGSAIFACAWVGAPKSVRADAQAAVKGIRTISQQPNFYCGWPTVARRKSGELICVWSGGREQHVCPFGRVDSMTSHDDGRTWTWPRTLLDGAIDDRDAGVVETPQGSLLVSTFTSLAYVPALEADRKALEAGKANEKTKARFARWNAAHTRLPDGVHKRELGTWLIRSTDGGVTWSARYACPVNSPHGPIALRDGRLLYAGKELWKEPKRNGVCESRDDGVTWTWLAEIPTRSGDDKEDYHELHAVEATDGTLVVQIRNHNKANDKETLQSESRDGGKTWSMPHSIGVWGFPSHLLRLRDGRLLMTYGHRRKPVGNLARISGDNGTSWSQPLTISADATSTDMGYPSTVELADGKLVTVWYEKLASAPLAVLRQADWRLT